MNQLTVIENLKPIELYAPGNIDNVILKISEEAKSFIPDTSTAAGRKEIASLAHKIARSKTFLDDCGKQLGEEAKKTLDTINIERKKIRENLDSLKEEIRKPLTDWEVAEEKRKNDHRIHLEEIKSLGQAIANNWMLKPLSDIEEGLKIVTEAKAFDWEEYQDDADILIPLVESQISSAIESKKIHEEQQAELKKLKEEKEKRDREEADRRAKEEEDARIKAEAEQKIINEAKAKADEEKRIADQLARDQKAAADKEAAIKREKELADQRVKQAEEKAAKDKEDALNKERKRIQDEKKALEDAEAKRQANIKHRTKVNNEVLKALMAEGLTEEHGKKVIVAMVSGLIPHVKLSY